MSEMQVISRRLTLWETLLSTSLRMLPLHHGRHRILDKIKKVPWSTDSKLVSFQYSGKRVEMDIDDLVGWHFAMVRTFDPEVAEVLCASAVANKRQIFWDIGANKGACAYAMAARLPQCQIALIEPQVSLSPLLKRNMEQLAKHRYEIHPVGVGTEDGEFQLAIPQSNKGRASLVFDKATCQHPVVTVKIMTATQIAKASAFGWPTLVKIDVEGFEAVVIQSLIPALQANICDAIVFENHPNQSDSFRIILETVLAYGYQIFAIKKTPFSTKLIPSKSIVPFASDYLVVKTSIVPTLELKKMIVLS